MELTGLLQIAPFQGMKEEELVALLFGLPNSLNTLNRVISLPGKVTYVKGCTFLHREGYGRE